MAIFFRATNRQEESFLLVSNVVICCPPIIIGCAPSSGSTLLRTLLGRHPSIASGGEVALLDKRALLKEPPERYRALIATWLAKGYPADFLGPSEELFEELDDYPWDRESLRAMCLSGPGYPEMLEAFWRRTVETRGARRWLDKCPSNIYCFDLISALYPGAKFLHLIRDARDTVVSYCGRGASPFRSVSRWYYATVLGLLYSSWPNYLRISYERLVQEPVKVLREICEFIDEPYCEEMLEPNPTGGKPRHAGWRLAAADAVEASSVGRFHGELTERQRAMFNQIVLSDSAARPLQQANIGSIPSPVELQRQLGYDTDLLSGASPLTDIELDTAWLEFENYQTRMRYRHGVEVECQVLLKGARGRTQIPALGRQCQTTAAAAALDRAAITTISSGAAVGVRRIAT